MNTELKAYIKAEAIVSAAFNFFINGMVAALIHHKADYVPTDVISIAIDLTATCLFICLLTALFSRASLRRTKTAGLLDMDSRVIKFVGRLFRRPIVFGLLAGIAAAVLLSVLAAPLFALLGIYALPFGLYIALKCFFTAIFGGGATALALYVGMGKV